MSNEANGGGMSRAEALEAVAEKAAAFHQAMLAPIGRMPEGYLDHAREELEKAFSALNALPADPNPARGEVVEVRAWVRTSTTDPNMYIIEGAGMWDGTWRGSIPPIAVAIITARVPLPSIPTIEGSCLPLSQERGA